MPRTVADGPPAFVALDGEGVTRPNGQHDYTLIGCSDGRTLEAWKLDGIATAAALDFILETAELHPGAKLVGFAFGYDTNMILRDLTREQLHAAAAGDYVTFKARGNIYRLKMLAGKMFYVGRGQWGRKGEGFKAQISTTVYDVFGFFQCSFVRALQDWKIATAEQIERIAGMKGKRGTFAQETRAEIIAYCLEECRLLVDLMGALGETLWAADLRPTLWNGAGAVAGALLREKGIADQIVRPDDAGLERATMGAYFGGRVERFTAGIVPDAVYDYDINSAYPAQIAALPSLHGRWRRAKEYEREAPYALWRAVWRPRRGQDHTLAPFPFRHKQAIYWPLRGDGWYHADEVRAARRALDRAFKIEIVDGYVYEPDEPQARPFAFVPALYAERRVYKDAGDPRHIVLKLALNSLYGKLAQGVGGGRSRPRYQSYFWAGMITAGTRAQMMRAAASVPRDALVSIATDGLFTRAPLSLELSDKLGGWELAETIEPGLCVVQAGFMLSPEAKVYKTRGMAKETIDYERLAAAWHSEGFMGVVTARDTRFIGAAYAVATGHYDEWRRWIDMERRIGFNPTPRKWPRYAAWGSWDSAELLRPPEGFDGLSDPYVPKDADLWLDEGEAGEALREMLYLMEQPDIDPT